MAQSDIKEQLKFQPRFLVAILSSSLLVGAIMTINSNKDLDMDLPDQPLIFSEHKVAFSEGHEIKLLDIRSKKAIAVGVKTFNGGDFFFSLDRIAWMGKRKLFVYAPLEKTISERGLPGIGIMFQGNELRIPFASSFSPKSNRVSYLNSQGMNLYIGKKGDNNSLGFKADLHILDLENKKDLILTHDAFAWGAPQWSPDEEMILYTRPESDNYFRQDYLSQVVVKSGISWQKMFQTTIFAYDFKKKKVYKLCSGANPQWSPDGNKVAFITETNKIGVLDIQINEVKELSIKGKIEPTTFKMAWSLDQEFIAYLGAPKHVLLSALLRVVSGSWYERPSSLWVVKIDGTGEDQYIETRNFGDIKFAPDIYKTLFGSK